MSVTISDVANEAGVSQSTVSKVLNHWSTISPQTVARVNAAIKKLNYIPNSRAVSFARQSTKNIVYLTNLGQGTAYLNPHMFDIMSGVHRSLTAKGYTLALVDPSEESFAGERAIQEIKRRSADGLIIHGSAVNEELASHLISENVPHIIIGHPDFESRLCWIDTDHALAGEYAASHMLSCGYTDVLFIAGKKSDILSCRRLKGFRKVMQLHKHRICDDRICYTNSTRLGAYAAVLSLLTAGKDRLPQAIVCENSVLALGICRALSELSLSIPDDIALLTFDRYPFAGVIDPSPTIIDINVYDMGVQAGDMMIRKLEHPDLLIQSYTTLPLLIQGESTVLQPVN